MAIAIVNGDATSILLPEGNLVIFLYFGSEVVNALPHLRRRWSMGSGDILIYANPVYGKMVDVFENFTGWYRENVPCAASEVGCAPDDSETVVIWRIG
jgi:hypothetical protein